MTYEVVELYPAVWPASKYSELVRKKNQSLVMVFPSPCGALSRRDVKITVRSAMVEKPTYPLQLASNTLHESCVFYVPYKEAVPHFKCLLNTFFPVHLSNLFRYWRESVRV